MQNNEVIASILSAVKVKLVNTFGSEFERIVDDKTVDALARKLGFVYGVRKVGGDEASDSGLDLLGWSDTQKEVYRLRLENTRLARAQDAELRRAQATIQKIQEKRGELAAPSTGFATDMPPRTQANSGVEA